MLNISIGTKFLKAAILCSAIKDLRNYLKGVHVRVSQGGDCFIESTNGSILFQHELSKQDIQTKDYSIIIPSDVVKLAIARKTPFVDLVAHESGKYTIAGIDFTPIQGNYPDLNRVIPKEKTTHDVNPKWCQFNPELLMTVTKAMRTSMETKNETYPLYFSDSGSLMCVSKEVTFPRCVVMPVRMKDY